MQLLLQHMAHPDAATTNGYTPLHISAREGQLDVASVLLEAGASHSMSTKVRLNTSRLCGSGTGAGLSCDECAFTLRNWSSLGLLLCFYLIGSNPVGWSNGAQVNQIST